MKTYLNRLVAGLSLLTLFFIFHSCNKLDTTTIGSELIPVVDNVTTFDTIIYVNALNEAFTDTTRLSADGDYALGTISSDPLFGTTTASILAQFKPPSFGSYPFINSKDSIFAIDSVVLCLAYKGAFGDTNQLQRVRVYEIDANEDFSFLEPTNRPYPAFDGEVTTAANGFIDIRTFREEKSIVYDKDTVKTANQLRIHLDTTLIGRKLVNLDTATSYKTDSAYNTVFKGLAVVTDSTAGSPNALMYFNLADQNTGLIVHYRVIVNGAVDTAFTVFSFNQISAVANIINRNNTGTELANYLNNGAGFDDKVLLQTHPDGTYATLQIPSLGTMSNRIIHKAELIMEQVPDAADDIFSVPGLLYLDAADTGDTYVSVIDPLFYSSNSPDFRTFGGFARLGTDGVGNTVNIYRFDLTRYVQSIVTQKATNFPLRLMAPTQVVHSRSAFNHLPNYSAFFLGYQVYGFNPPARGIWFDHTPIY